MIVKAKAFNPTAVRGFLALEGVNGAGKGTLLSSILTWLQAHSVDTIATREPGGTELGNALRRLLLELPGSSRSPMAEAFLFAADRTDHVHRLIEPTLRSGKRVITDRFLYSSLAFQGYGRKLPIETLSQLNALAVGKCLPDAVILLDLEPEVGLRRVADRKRLESNTQGKEDKDSFELEELEFHRRLRDGFLTIAKERPESFLVINANAAPSEVFEQVVPLLEAWIAAPLEQNL